MIPAPKRRNVARLKEQLADIEVGDEVFALFRDDRHGVFTIFSEVYETTAGDWLLGGHPFASKSKPSDVLLEIEPDFDDSGGAETEVSHGDLVSVIVASAGRLPGAEVTGTALAGHCDDMLTVAGYIVGGKRVKQAWVHEISDPAVQKRQPATEAE